jgi:hypothetical protein
MRVNHQKVMAGATTQAERRFKKDRPDSGF